MKSLVQYCCFLFCLNSFSQAANNQEKIKTLLNSYFHNDREIIHVQFNKNIYVNNEDIAFKGYILSKNTNLPSINTSNIQLVMYDEKEQVVQKQLLYASNGTFSGVINLNKKFKTGKYLFHFYTNWMNNFNEDDSFSQILTIYDLEEPFHFDAKEPNLENVKIDFFPEGGSIIDGINNTIGVRIRDCNDKAIQLNNIIIQDSKLNELYRFSTNKMGNGAFYLLADQNEKYTLKITYEKLTLSKELPKVMLTGIRISFNNNLPKNKLVVEVKTNERGLDLFQNKKFNLLIQQNDFSILKEINFNNKEREQTILLDNSSLPNGVNCIRLIDEELNEITQRLIYNYTAVEPITTITAKGIANDSIQLAVNTNLIQANISASVLTENNICIENKTSILGTFYLNAYLETPEIDNYCYFDPENKDKKKDMNLLMLNQIRGKFVWENIKSNPPKINYKFNKGLTISGNINRPIEPNSNKKLLLVSLKDNLFEKTTVEKDNSFKFENFYVQDSTVYILQIENEKKSSIYTKMVAKVYQNETKFNLPINFIKSNCPIEKKGKDSLIFSASKLSKKAINLDEITVINTFKKEVFTHKNEMSLNARAFKIEDNEFGNVIDFIGRNGYRTGIDPEENTVFIRSNRSTFGQDSPAVFIDDFLIFDYNLLFTIDLSSVDEIYIDQTGFSDTAIGYSGTIKIFLKKGYEEKNYKTKFTTLIATSGFSKNIEYKNTAFDTQKEFYTFGALKWSPKNTLKENQSFEYKFPKGNQKVIQVFIEGFSTDGQLISEMHNVPIE